MCGWGLAADLLTLRDLLLLFALSLEPDLVPSLNPLKAALVDATLL